MQGKPAALLVTCGDAIENNADVIQVEFDREMEYLGSRVMGKYIVPNCTLPKGTGGQGGYIRLGRCSRIYKRSIKNR